MHIDRCAMDGDDLALLEPPANIPPQRFEARSLLFDQFDQFRRRVDSAEIGGMDSVYRRAFDVLTSDKVAKALDVTREDPRPPRPLRAWVQPAILATVHRCGTTSF